MAAFATLAAHADSFAPAAAPLGHFLLRGGFVGTKRRLEWMAESRDIGQRRLAHNPILARKRKDT